MANYPYFSVQDDAYDDELASFLGSKGCSTDKSR